MLLVRAETRASLVVTGEGTDEARAAVQDDAEEAVKNAVKVERTEAPSKSKGSK